MTSDAPVGVLSSLVRRENGVRGLLEVDSPQVGRLAVAMASRPVRRRRLPLVEAAQQLGRLGDLVDDEAVADQDADVGDQLREDNLGPDEVDHDVGAVQAEVCGN